MIAVSMLDNSITHAHTYVIVVLCVPVATHGHLPSIKYKHIFRITLSVHTNRSPSCIRYFITIADSSLEFIYFIFTSCTTHSTHLFRRGAVRSTSLRSGTRQDDHRPDGRTTYRTDFTANQLVGLLGTHSCSAFTLTPTSWLDCSSHGFHRQLC